MCTLFGAIFTWLRLSSGSAWPPAIAHAGLNASTGLDTPVAATATHLGLTQVTILGSSG